MNHTLRFFFLTIFLAAAALMMVGCTTTGEPVEEVDNLAVDISDTLPGLGPGLDPSGRDDF